MEAPKQVSSARTLGGFLFCYSSFAIVRVRDAPISSTSIVLLDLVTSNLSASFVCCVLDLWTLPTLLFASSTRLISLLDARVARDNLAWLLHSLNFADRQFDSTTILLPTPPSGTSTSKATGGNRRDGRKWSRR